MIALQLVKLSILVEGACDVVCDADRLEGPEEDADCVEWAGVELPDCNAADLRFFDED